MIPIGALNLVARIPGGHCLLLCGSCSQGGIQLAAARGKQAQGRRADMCR